MSELGPLGPDDPAYAAFVSALHGAGLPADDLEGEARLFLLSSGSEAKAFGGLEGDGPDQLIRSVVVPVPGRGRGSGHRIVEALAEQALADGAERLWLLTTSADRFFAKLGWTVRDRASAPDAIRATRQFSGLCPASAVLMCRRLA